ncbi:Ger(x)C family spore germination protein [Paenibacillus sp. J5C_2022]|uniref:Ger(x)C family spore germination protein n=1 Tax=Paenibacillus sp. J5C2022 TaxID=2977129 RepID=UPI0021D30909|nr:Ger(x)C family spore germination protein [Paenibacillus sp. J5C2022]MCU6708762.1 Ger(x)C family spore germination protein [Paenibacillus sp. J5C2022]
MKRRLVAAVATFLLLGFLTGCWDNKELDEYGYVQAVAIDSAEAGRISLTTHFYNPASKTEMTGEAGPGTKGINIRTSGETVFDAVRDIPLYFGRKAKWDHIRVILMGEQLARSQNIGEVFDYMSRDHEPRGTVLPLITEGNAAKYLEIKPFIEQTIGQQYKKMETQSARYSAKSSNIPLYELAIQLKGVTEVSVLPHISKSGNIAVVSGVALLKKGKLSYTLGARDTESYMMLSNQYKEGILEFPCTGNALAEGQVQRKESFEVFTLQSRTTPHVKDDTVLVDVGIRIRGVVGELRCSSINTIPDMKRFEEKIEAQIERQIRHTISILQQQRLDAIGIGTKIYRKDPTLWKRWKPTWDERFAKIRFDVTVDVQALNSGLNVGTPFGKEENERP